MSGSPSSRGVQNPNSDLADGGLRLVVLAVLPRAQSLNLKGNLIQLYSEDSDPCNETVKQYLLGNYTNTRLS